MKYIEMDCFYFNINIFVCMMLSPLIAVFNQNMVPMDFAKWPRCVVLNNDITTYCPTRRYHYIQPVISTTCIRKLLVLFTTGNVDESVRKMTISRRF